MNDSSLSQPNVVYYPSVIAVVANENPLRSLCQKTGCLLLLGGLFYLLAALPAQATTTPPIAPTTANVEETVRAFFADVPVMIEIARCESKFRQFTDSGNVLRGGYGQNMIGIFQFNGPVHQSAAQRLGFDIETVTGNLEYAKHLYKTSGTDPWVSSYACWNTASQSNSSADFTTLVFGQTHLAVRLLQERLNAAGFTIAETGPGALGEETEKFGTLTRTALRRFQCAEVSICAGDEHSTGYGLYDEKTHQALLAYAAPKAGTKKVTASADKLSAERRSALLIQIQDLLAQVAKLQAKLALLRTT